MEPTADPNAHSTAGLLYAKRPEVAELRELLMLVAQDLALPGTTRSSAR